MGEELVKRDYHLSNLHIGERERERERKRGYFGQTIPIWAMVGEEKLVGCYRRRRRRLRLERIREEID